MSEELRSQAEILAAIAGAREDLTTGLADLQATVEELNSRPLLTDEEKKALEEQAESGELGEDMRTLVGKIKDGEDTWEQVFSGESPHGSLLQGHLTRMFEEHKEDIALAFEELIEAEEAKGNFIFDEVPTTEA
jgi:uncharacterized protein HemY